MRNGRVLFATHSLHFRVHTRVLLTLLVACAVTAALWADSPRQPALAEPPTQTQPAALAGRTPGRASAVTP